MPFSCLCVCKHHTDHLIHNDFMFWASSNRCGRFNLLFVEYVSSIDLLGAERFIGVCLANTWKSENEIDKLIKIGTERTG